MIEGFGGLLALASPRYDGNDPLPDETGIGVKPGHSDGGLNTCS
jgi:hypothetical protein